MKVKRPLKGTEVEIILASIRSFTAFFKWLMAKIASLIFFS
jgi:hypothetical protein